MPETTAVTPTFLEQGKAIIADQKDDTFVADVDLQGANASVKKSIGRGWAVFAWAKYLWTGQRSAGAGVQKTFLVARPPWHTRLWCRATGHYFEFRTPTHNRVCVACGWHECIGPMRSDGSRDEGHTGY